MKYFSRDGWRQMSLKLYKIKNYLGTINRIAGNKEENASSHAVSSEITLFLWNIFGS